MLAAKQMKESLYTAIKKKKFLITMTNEFFD